MVPGGTRLVPASTWPCSVSEGVLGHSSVTRQPLGRSHRIRFLTQTSSRREFQPRCWADEIRWGAVPSQKSYVKLLNYAHIATFLDILSWNRARIVGILL